jgi:DNA-binding transcriptional regulator YiaG
MSKTERRAKSGILGSVDDTVTGLQRTKVSQPVFAHVLNVRKDAACKWERGEKRPDGPSLKLLNLVRAKGLQALA